jgi:hypothetical protein
MHYVDKIQHLSQNISLDGTWKLWGADSRSIIHDQQIIFNPPQAIEATIPGEVHLDLWKEGLIDDPYIGSNVLKARGNLGVALLLSTSAGCDLLGAISGSHSCYRLRRDAIYWNQSAR